MRRPLPVVLPRLALALVLGSAATLSACGAGAGTTGSADNPDPAQVVVGTTPTASEATTTAPAPPETASAPASPAPSERAGLSDLQVKAQEQASLRKKRATELTAELAAQLERKRAERDRLAAVAAANPLAGRTMGVYQGPLEPTWDPYARSSGATRATLAEIALRPKAKWFGSFIPDGEIYAKTRDYVVGSQHGDPEALVQLAMFRMVPWEQDACRRLPTASEQASYRRWTDEFARAIGAAHAAVILQPDGPFALCAPGGSTLPSRLIAYSTQKLAALPHTSVYLDGGAGDWPSVNGQGGSTAAADFLVAAGVRYARGVALNSTHYSPTEDDVRRGAEIVAELARRGITGKKVVINTSNNGRGFEFGTYTGPDPDNAFPCSSKTDTRTCVSLGIPPTTEVGAARWGLPDDVRRLATANVDAYLWFGRPWLYRQAEPFQLSRALAVVRSSPWFS